jgi:hypothetical protein
MRGQNNNRAVRDAKVIELLEKQADEPIERHHPVRIYRPRPLWNVGHRRCGWCYAKALLHSVTLLRLVLPETLLLSGLRLIKLPD